MPLDTDIAVDDLRSKAPRNDRKLLSAKERHLSIYAAVRFPN